MTSHPSRIRPILLDLPEGEATAHNQALQDGAIRTIIRFAAHSGVEFRSAILLRILGAIPGFPRLSIKDLLAASAAAGLPLVGGHAELRELEGGGPFLAYLRRADEAAAGLDLVHVHEVRSRSVVTADDRFGTERMPRGVFEERWSGLVLRLADPSVTAPGTGNAELEAYRRSVEVLPGMLSPSECAELIEYCEDACFRRSRVMQKRDGKDAGGDVVQTRVRSSSSVVLQDRGHPLLARLYEAVARHEGVSERDIEHIQCVRYKRAQRFRSHFDGGVDLPRLATYLLYLNDDFDGGETYFPMLDLSIAPKSGSCLRFASCTADGRVLWQSEHGGLPVTRGVKYALNIWVRCPIRLAAAA